MNKKIDCYQDHCKSNNTSDEESSLDLQSRLNKSFAPDNSRTKRSKRPVAINRDRILINVPLQDTTVHVNVNNDNSYTYPEPIRKIVNDQQKHIEKKSEIYHQKDTIGNNSPKSHILHNMSTDNQNMQNCVNTCDENDENLLKKYNSTKKLILQLYKEKYRDLERKLQREALLDSQRSTLPMTSNNVDINIRCTPLENCINEKLDMTQCTEAERIETNIISKDSDADSDISILEVPVPPKPQPPLINLQDSDDESTKRVHNSKTTKVSHPNRKKKKRKKKLKSRSNVTNNVESSKDSCVNEQYSEMDFTVQKNNQLSECDARSNNTVLTTSKTPIPAFNSETSKSASAKQHENLLQKHKSRFNDSNVHQLQANKKNIYAGVGVHVPGLPGNTFVPSTMMLVNNVQSVDFTDDYSVLQINAPVANDQLSRSRKRQHEFENYAGSSAKQAKYNDKGTENNVKLMTNVDDKTEKCVSDVKENEGVVLSKDVPKAEDLNITETQKKSELNNLDKNLTPKPSNERTSQNVMCTDCHQDVKCHFPESLEPLKCHTLDSQEHHQEAPKKVCLMCGIHEAACKGTCESCYIRRCKRCKETGHKSTECPDLWKRYEMEKTSEINNPASLADITTSSNLPIYFTCTKGAHESCMCKDHQSQFPTPVFVSKYRDPVENQNNSNSTNPPRNCEPVSNNDLTSSTDFIPLSSTPKDSTENEEILFSYGDSKKEGGKCKIIHLIKAKSKLVQYNITGIIENRIAPTFLDWLSTLTSFYIKICREKDNSLKLHIRAEHYDYCHIRNILERWFLIDDYDKDHWFPTCLPRNRVEFCKFITDKLAELDKDYEHAGALWTSISKLKRMLRYPTGNRNPSDIKKKLQQAQIKLLMVMHSKPQKSTTARRFGKHVELIQNMKCTLVPTTLYLRAIYTYSRIFAPHTPPNMMNWLNTYSMHFDKWKSKQLTNQTGQDYDPENTSLCVPSQEGELPSELPETPKKIPVLVTTKQKDFTIVEYSPGYNISQQIDMPATNDCRIPLSFSTLEHNYLSEPMIESCVTNTTDDTGVSPSYINSKHRNSDNLIPIITKSIPSSNSKNVSTSQPKPKIVEFVDLEQELENDVNNGTT